MNEHFIAIRVGQRYLAVQTCDSGYDYSIYDSAYRLMDGGQIDRPDILIDRICSDIKAAHKLPEFPLEKVDYEELMEQVYKAEIDA